MPIAGYLRLVANPSSQTRRQRAAIVLAQTGPAWFLIILALVLPSGRYSSESAWTLYAVLLVLSVFIAYPVATYFEVRHVIANRGKSSAIGWNLSELTDSEIRWHFRLTNYHELELSFIALAVLFIRLT